MRKNDFIKRACYLFIIPLLFVSGKPLSNKVPQIIGEIDSRFLYEDFNSLDESRWIIQQYSWNENGARMVPENIIINNSEMTLTVSSDKNSGVKKYKASGVGDSRFFLYGYFEVQMKSEIVPGTVSSFFLMNKYSEKEWEHREIDIEFSGNKTDTIQMTTHYFAKGGTDHQFSETKKETGFDIRKKFHRYGILWRPESVSWYIDGKLIYTENKYVPQEPLQIRINHWPGDMSVPGVENWLGRLDNKRLPSRTVYDWIKVVPLEEFDNLFR